MLSSVLVFEREEMTSAQRDYFDDYMDSLYPNATRLRSATYKYNCHSFAWYSDSPSNIWWMNDPSPYMTDGSYTQYPNPAISRKIYYPMPGNEHSGVITAVSGSIITVTSKWGAYGLYMHSHIYCPYFSIYPNSYWSII